MSLEAIPADQMGYGPWPGPMVCGGLRCMSSVWGQFIRGVLAGELIAGGSRRDRPEIQSPADLVAYCQAQHEELRPLTAQA